VSLLLPARGAANVEPTAALDVRVVWAHNQTHDIDPRIAVLVKNLGLSQFTGYQLEDEAAIALAPAKAEQLRLPSGDWLTVTLLGQVDDKMRLQVEVQELKFKTVVSLAPKATLAIGGPPYQGGVLILAMTRPAS
jgi:hypothetical protein